MTIRLTDGARETIAGEHDAAAERIDALAASLPTAVDGGLGEGHLLAIVAAVAATSGDIAIINAVTRDQVNEIGADFGTAESEVAANFNGLAGVVQ
ncbi:hypothetical protein [Nocardioides sp.]|uniref:hypothetical protein n=1 Tax=Nocardioides sp. TaxID=35761 RepID=UPI002737572E|nr:hypothetical protein [Nocardioides sp.]MDP3893189.1 hypothetical protein [Nocardioides sp.]